MKQTTTPSKLIILDPLTRFLNPAPPSPPMASGGMRGGAGDSMKTCDISLSIFQNHRQTKVTTQKQYKYYNNYNKSTIDHRS